MRRFCLTASFVTLFLMSTQVANANVFVGQTNLTIHVKGQTVSGKLVGNPKCRPNQTIELFVDGASQGTTTTDGSGNYSFTGSFSAGSTVYTFFAGSKTGQHPNRFVCTPAVSRVVKIKGHGNDNDDHGEHGDHGNQGDHGDDDADAVSTFARLPFTLRL